MKRMFKKTLCAVLACALLVTMLAGTVVFAADTHNVTLDYDATLGSVTVNGSSETASLAATEVWLASASLAADTSLEIFTGITATAPEELAYTAGSKTIDGVSYSGYVTGGNPVFTDGVLTEGSGLRIEAERSGTISFAVKLGKGKSFCAANATDYTNLITEETNDTDGSVFAAYSFDVKAGNAYYVWGNGTKLQFYGATFEEKEMIEITAGDTVTITSTPNSSGLLGNVSLDDDTITLTKSSDMTVCTFTMPDYDVVVSVDFVTSAIVDEIAAFPFEYIRGTNESEDSVFEDLDLITTCATTIGSPDISWTSSNPDVITVGGDVYPSNVDTVVELTGIFTWQDYPNLYLTKTFTLTVPADTDDEAAVQAAANALTLGDTSAVKTNLDLPTSGIRNTTITWSSSDESVLTNEGLVYPSDEVEYNVTLTATITRDAASTTKTFDITIAIVYPLSIDRIAVSNADGDVVLTPSDGGYLSHIVFTENIPNMTSDEFIMAAVYNADETILLDAVSFNLLECVNNTEYYNSNDQYIIYLDANAVPVYDDCVIKVFAFENTDNMAPMLTEPAVFDYSVASSPTVYVAGDSTACSYSHSGSSSVYPRTGWAQVLGDYFNSTVTVSDQALSGRSSLSFLSETAYTTIKNGIKSGDYFIIQFGHNDSKAEAGRFTDPTTDRFTDGSYKKNIWENYVNVALDKGAYPILTTSISRRKTSDSGLEAYVNAAKELGYELGIPVVDLYGKTNAYINEVGTEQAKDIFNYVKYHDSRFVSNSGFLTSSYYTAGDSDDTHINYYGAQMISQWFCDELERLGHPLVERRNDHTMTVEELPSYADATSVD